jgi:hypothetical protein
MPNQSRRCDQKIDPMRLSLLHGHHMGAGIGSDSVDSDVAASMRLDLRGANRSFDIRIAVKYVLVLYLQIIRPKHVLYNLLFAVIQHSVMRSMKGKAVKLRFEVAWAECTATATAYP